MKMATKYFWNIGILILYIDKIALPGRLIHVKCAHLNQTCGILYKAIVLLVPKMFVIDKTIIMEFIGINYSLLIYYDFHITDK